MNWGDVGLFVGFIIYGLLLTLLDRRILSNIDDEPKMLFYAFIFTLFLFGVIGAWATLGDTLEIWGVLYFVISKFVGRESYEVGTGEAHALPA